MGINIINDGKPYIDALKSLQYRIPVPWPDPIGPVKLEALDWLVASYVQTLPAVIQRLEAIEQHLEQGLQEGQPFIRAKERPNVGEHALQELSQGIQRLNERMDAIEKRLV
jgi:hypothetical protein